MTDPIGGHLQEVLHAVHAIGGVLQQNLVVLFALGVVFVKWLILRIFGDAPAQRSANLSMPEDLFYAAFGLVLGDFINPSGEIRKKFTAIGSTTIGTDFSVVVVFMVLVAFLVHWFVKLANDRAEIVFPTAPATGFDSTRLLAIFVFGLGYCIQLGIVLPCIYCITRLIE